MGHYASAMYAIALHLSICLSGAVIVSKWLNGFSLSYIVLKGIRLSP